MTKRTTMTDFQPRAHACVSGFTLLEVMVALLVLSIGLLGLAALQTTSLKFNQQSYGRTQATLLTYDIIDRIRANKNDNAMINANYDNVALGSVPSGPNCASTSLASPYCSEDDIANFDIRQWNTAVGNLLPQGQGAVCRGTFNASLTCTVSGTTYRVAITWKESDLDARLNVEALP